MSDIWISAGSCFLLGMLTSIHPCPLTSNIAAITLLTGWYGKTARSLITAFVFISGYLFTYMGISILLVSGIFTVPVINEILHRIIPVFLGPLMIFTGMILSDILNFRNSGTGFRPKIAGSKKTYVFYAFPIGAVLGLNFCPATAAIFFGLLIPLAIDKEMIFLFPVLYAAGIAIPLVVLSLVIYRSGKIFLEKKWQRRVPHVAGWLLILAGIIITLRKLIF